MAREICGHDRHRATEEAKRRCGHALILDRYESLNTPAHGFSEDGERISRAGVELEISVRTARELLARVTPECLSFGVG
jgi:hypothetical protein